MRPQDATPFDLVMLAGFAGGCLAGAIAAWRSGVYIGVAACLLLGLLAAWSFVESFRQGVRRPTPFERFEQRLLIRALAVFFGGGLALALGWQWLRAAPLPGSRAANAAIGLLAIGVWLLASLAAVRRLRTKHETSAAYKRRVGYVEPPAEPDR
jgi:hypothetical protein